jgi:hypothetical protein
VLAHFLREGLPGRATGVELDPWLAQFAQAWTEGHPQLEVISGSALDLDLSPYTDFYLFNPFDQGVLQQFIEQVEAQVADGLADDERQQPAEPENNGGDDNGGDNGGGGGFDDSDQ